LTFGDHEILGMTEERKKAFDLAAEAAKQILTLSTGIIALTITFLKDIFQIASHAISKCTFGVLIGAWVLFITAAVAGVFTLYNLSSRALDPEPELRGSRAQTAAKWQMILFLAGLGAMVAFGVLLVLNK
jgi:hypothetical protein